MLTLNQIRSDELKYLSAIGSGDVERILSSRLVEEGVSLVAAIVVVIVVVAMVELLRWFG